MICPQPVILSQKTDGLLPIARSNDSFSTTKTRVLLVHGSADPVVPVASLHEAKTQLEHLGMNVTADVSMGVGHCLDPVGLRMSGELVAEALTN